MDILHEAKRVFEIETDSLKVVKEALNENVVKLVDLIQNSEGRVIITGMGKAGHVGRKIAATMSSLGTVSYFLHPAEGLHGDLGGIKKGDIVIAFSKSGESDEVLSLMPSIKQIGAKLISVTCREKSALSNNADLSIVLPIQEEASSHKLAPTTSTTAMLVFGDALAVVLEKLNDFKPEDYAIFHPNGALGKRLLLVVETLMAKDEANPVISYDANLKETIVVMSSKGYGGVSVVDNAGKLVGLVTDGDLRRVIENANDFDIFNISVKEFMTKSPFRINKNEKAINALSVMENGQSPISILPVVDDDDRAVGMLRIHDIIRAGVV
jgi:arabinose-5-phosphate isomerase